MTAFDPVQEVPSGTTIIEASAGTGKTFAIVTLAARLIAEGSATIDTLLLVTFSRAATQELRERTRERLRRVASALADPAGAAASPDPLIRYLAATDAALRRERLLRALADFSAGTIATTHSFCQRMLDSLGIAGDWQTDWQFTEDIGPLVREVTIDLFLRGYAGAADSAPELSALRQVALAATADRHARLRPAAGMESEAAQRSAFAAAVRAEVARRKRLRGIRDFDDALSTLHEVLADPECGPAACARIGAGFRAVLVDEFQDTDPVQWDILRRCFHGSTTLVLVGDPKQAIYAFRGAEVLSYLDAVRQAAQRRALALNWRSDAGLVAALGQLYGGAALGHDDIVAQPVAAHHAKSRLAGRVPLRLRYFSRTGFGPLNRAGFPEVARVRPQVAADAAADIRRLLHDPPQLDCDGERRLAAGDIAVLVRTHAQVELVRAALARQGVPSVLAGGTSVFATASALHWLWVLQALEQPHRGDRVRLAALTPLIGWTAAELTEGDEDRLSGLARTLRELAVIFETVGFAALVEKLAAQSRFPQRLLGQAGGERALTDLRQVGQLLHAAAVSDTLGLPALAQWLADRVRDPAQASAADRSRRLDSDAAAVQVATVHASKGLEFPVVYVPFGWDGARLPYPETLLLHDDQGQRVLDVGGPQGYGYAQDKLRADEEDAGEQLRLLYVALTRARCQAVLWWAPTAGTSSAPLHRMIFGRPDGAGGIPGVARVPANDQIGPLLESWAAAAAPHISVEEIAAEDGLPLPRAEPQPARPLAAAHLPRVLDAGWRRTSYSALTAAAHDSPHRAGTGDGELPVTVDEPMAVAVLDAKDVVPPGLPSPLNGFAGGTGFGTLVHTILERIDTSAKDLAAEIRERCAAAVQETYTDADPDELATGLTAVLHSPLGLGPAGLTLAQIDPRDRLAELDFEIPLGSGAAGATLKAVAAVLAQWLPPDDPLVGYPALLAEIPDGATVLRGFLTGSIDAVWRLPGQPQQYVIADYKTNRLGAEELSTGHYHHDALVREMSRSHYPLQALLYSVALHRYLRWRLTAYDPAQHLGGMAYLFVRGMAGPDVPPGTGVFRWTPPAALTIAVSDLLAGRHE